MRSALLSLLLFLAARTAEPCTTFLMTEEGKPFVGKSYDYEIGHGQAVHNKRGVAKRALPLEPGVHLAEWVSEYASLTFNQYGREMPNGGLNEAGLVVEIMWLNSTRTPDPDPRPALNELQWIQYQLDNFATVAEVVTHAPRLRVARVYGKVHYLACDLTGDCAALEYLEGELTVTHGADLVAPTLTNDTYADSRAHLKTYRGFGGKRAIPNGRGSLARFVRASAMARGAREKHGTDGVFEILEAVNLGEATRWQIAYDLEQRVVHFRTGKNDPIKRIALSDFAPGCDQPAMVLDLETTAAGDVGPRFQPYSPAQNAALLDKSLAHVASSLPEGAALAIAAYPEQLPCTLLAPAN